MSSPEKLQFPPRQEFKTSVITGVDTASIDLSASEEMYRAYIIILRGQFAKDILTDNPTNDCLHQSLVEVFENTDPNAVLQNLLRRQYTYGYMSQSLLTAYGFTGSPDQFDSRPYYGPFPAQLPTDFIDDLYQQVVQLSSTTRFDDLIAMNQVFAESGLLEKLQAMQALFDEPRAEVEFPGDVVHDLAKEIAFNEDIGLGLAQADAAYLLCFIPAQIRRILKMSLVADLKHKSMKDQLTDATDAELKCLDLMTRYTKIFNLTIEGWDDVALQLTTSEQKRIEIAQLSSELPAIADEVRNTLNSQNGQRFQEALFRTGHMLEDGVSSAAQKSSSVFLQNTDFGHGLNNFNDYAFAGILLGAIDDRERREDFESNQKAVILEDDLSQMQLWSSIVTDHSPYSIDDSGKFTNPDGLVEQATDPQTTLFVLDIQNGNEEWAGVDVAEQVINTRIGSKINLPQARVIVWSTSAQHAKTAEQILRKKYKNDNRVSFNTSQGQVLVLCKTKKISEKGFSASY